METKTADHIKLTASTWRDQNHDYSEKGYVTVIQPAGKTHFDACGWIEELKDAHTWKPGTYAVDIQENIFLAEGHRWTLAYQTSADALEALKPIKFPVTGGPLADAMAARMREMVKKLHASGEVQEVMALSWLPDENRWLYLVKTPAAWMFPRFVIGTTDEALECPEWNFQCGPEWTAQHEWDALNHGDH